MNTIVKHTVGFIASIVLTLLQAALQLLMFMHLTEGKDGRLQSFKVIFAIIITLITVIGTYWVMQGGHSSHL
ncbi:MAG: cytochrome C oxidase subunit IV family protein [Staphylococcus epidermidis]|nr:cytochrome C oxidase subunit IV family protein [Staphylococcus epidermidis]